MRRGCDRGMKWRRRGLVIAGLVASTASSQVPGWELWSDDASIAPTTLTAQVPSVRYLVHAELRGPGPFEGLDGWVAARLNVAPSQSTPVTTIEIRSITRPDQMPV